MGAVPEAFSKKADPAMQGAQSKLLLYRVSFGNGHEFHVESMRQRRDNSGYSSRAL